MGIRRFLGRGPGEQEGPPDATFPDFSVGEILAAGLEPWQLVTQTDPETGEPDIAIVDLTGEIAATFSRQAGFIETSWDSSPRPAKLLRGEIVSEAYARELVDRVTVVAARRLFERHLSPNQLA